MFLGVMHIVGNSTMPMKIRVYYDGNFRKYNEDNTKYEIECVFEDGKSAAWIVLKHPFSAQCIQDL